MNEKNYIFESIDVFFDFRIHSSTVSFIVNEWTILSFLIFHFVFFQDDYIITKNISLFEHFFVDLISFLNIFSSMTRLLEKENKYFDYANNQEKINQKVWNVKHDNVFSVINDATNFFIISKSLKNQHEQIKKCYKLKKIYRLQIFNVFNFNKISKNEKNTFWKQRFNIYWQIFFIFVLFNFCVFFVVLKTYEIATIFFSCAISKNIVQNIIFDRSSNYLKNIEKYIVCMFVATYKNAFE